MGRAWQETVIPSTQSRLRRRDTFSFSGVFRNCRNEREHAKRLFEFIQKLKGDNEAIKVVTEAPLVMGSDVDNLKAAIAGEHYENTEMYPQFAEVAEKEGYVEVAARLRAIGKAEEYHEKRYRRLLEEVEKGTFFKRDGEVAWVCLECGYIHYGTEPPEECPSCGHPKAYYVAQDLLSI